MFKPQFHMKKTLLLLFFCFAMASVWADGPFRVHRFDSFKDLSVTSNSIVFLGNSITDMHDWSEAFGNANILNRGVSGALSSEILENLDPIVSGHPKAVFLMIGTNDLGSGVAPEQVAANIRRIVERFRKESPVTKLYLQSVLPSTVGTRTLENERATNELIQQIARDYDAVYVNLWDPLYDICQNQNNTLDGLHLKASGYKIWCDIIAQYVGADCVYPSNTIGVQNHSSLWGSNAMRATYFSVLPIRKSDILFFGDEMVKCGEWKELLPYAPIQNRGIGWGYDGTGNSIATVSGLVDATFSNPTGNNKDPYAILLYSGTGNVNDDMPLDSVKAQYKQLVQKVRAYAPNSKLYLVTLMPTEHKNGRIKEFNKFLQKWCAASENLEYIDIYTRLVKKGVANPEFFSGNYLMGKGYREVADVLSAYFPMDEVGLLSDKVIQMQRDILETAYQTKSDTLLQDFFEWWSKSYQADTVTDDPYKAEAYKVFYAFFDPIMVDNKGYMNSGHYKESQYFVIEPKLRWLGIVDSISLEEGSEELLVESRPSFSFNKFYKNSVMWDTNMVFFPPISHPKCLYLTDTYREILDDFFPEGDDWSIDALEQASHAEFLNRYVYFYKYSYWKKYHYASDPVVNSITLDEKRTRAYVRFSCLHQHYDGFAYLEKRDGKWILVRMGGDIDVD